MIPFYMHDDDWEQPLQKPRRALPKRDAGIAKVLEREQQPVALPIAKADAILPVALLQKKLGKAAWRLWAYLLTIRNPKSETHPAAKGMAKGACLTLVQVERALARLRKFQLVQDQGYTYMQVPCRCAKDMGPHVHKVYLRKVFGMLRLAADGLSQTTLVPRETAQLVQDAAAHGGTRAGAGRPKGSPNKPRPDASEKISSGGAYKYQVPVSSEEPYGSSSESEVSLRADFCDPVEEKAERTNPLRIQAPILWCVLGSTHSSQKGDEVSMSIPSQPKEEPLRTVLPANEVAAPVPAIADGAACDLLAVLTSAQGAQCVEFGGGYTGPKQRFTPEDMRAASDLTNEINVLRVPAPPKVDLAAGEDDQLALLGAAFRAAHEKVLHSDYWRPPKGQTPKARAALLAAAQALATERISPTAWAYFSFLQWKAMNKKAAPTPQWVWNHQRIHEGADWCRDEVGTVNTARPLPVKATSELIKRLGVLRSQLGWGKPTAGVVSSVLPDQVRRVLLAQQEQQRADAQVDIERRIVSGEWVWG